MPIIHLNLNVECKDCDAETKEAINTLTSNIKQAFVQACENAGESLQITETQTLHPGDGTSEPTTEEYSGEYFTFSREDVEQLRNIVNNAADAINHGQDDAQTMMNLMEASAMLTNKLESS